MGQQAADGRAAADSALDRGADVLLQAERALIAGLPEQPMVVDVGANVGEFAEAVLAVRPGAWVFAIEPQATAAAEMRRRLGADERVQVLTAAAGARRERRVLHSDAENSYLATFYPRPHMPMIQTRPIGEVEVWPLAEIEAVAAMPRIDLLKIDTEGHELAVLEGAVRLSSGTALIAFEHFEGETRYTDNTLADFRTLLAGFDIAPLTDPDVEETYMWVAKKEEAL